MLIIHKQPWMSGKVGEGRLGKTSADPPISMSAQALDLYFGYSFLKVKLCNF